MNRLGIAIPCLVRTPALPSVSQLLFLFLVGMFISLMGCNRRAGAANEQQAREVLTAALDAWKAGYKADQLPGQSGRRMIIGDPDWKQGKYLIDYELVGRGVFDGTSLRVPAVLTLKHGSRGPKKVAVNYILGVDPAFTLHRDAD